MATFVLVHGAWSGAHGFRHVRRDERDVEEPRSGHRLDPRDGVVRRVARRVCRRRDRDAVDHLGPALVVGDGAADDAGEVREAAQVRVVELTRAEVPLAEARRRVAHEHLGQDALLESEHASAAARRADARAESVPTGEQRGARRRARRVGPHVPEEEPVGGKRSGRFGSVRVLNGQPKNPHRGEDIAAPAGAEVVATNDGIVRLTVDHLFSGLGIYVDHGLGLYSMYFHLSEVLVKDGDPVKAGQVIGKVGASGRATGPHLHWGARLNGAWINPYALVGLPLLNGAGSR